MEASDGREHRDATGAGIGDDGKSAAHAGGAALHKRTYQACLPCRRRKVRCDLGSVDEPGDPPCLRCRREKKDCIFSETRRKRKADEDGGGDLDPEFVARNKRSSTGLGANAGSSDGFGDANIGGIQVVDDGPDTSRTMTPLGGDAEDDTGVKDGHKNREVGNETAAALFRQPITQPGDALRMLFDAASHTEAEGRKASLHQSGGGDGSSQHPVPRARTFSSGAAARALQKRNAEQTAIDPQAMVLQDKGTAMEETQDSPDLIEALKAWSTLRFVRAGWFTAREALGYIDYFYEHLAPLTPISPPDFRSYDTHAKLLAEEPMLVVTMLTIVARYKSLSGPGGNIRTLRIHDKLWDYLQGMITRMFWGQEQFGGGFCGAGGTKVIGDPDARRRGLRSLGTVESLLLLSDWMPRAMHFPPGDDANELTVPTVSMDADFVEEQPNSHAAWTEPALRSDRMVWSLVGMAYTLSWELGVFDSIVECGRWNPGPQDKTMYDPERADRLGRMLLVYVSQACGRLGYPNMMPNQGNETNFNFLKMDIPAGTYPAPYNTITLEDRMQRAWSELTAFMRQCNSDLFESKRRTHESIQNGEYMRYLERWGPKLREWKSRFDQSDIAPKARAILTIEYEYTRTYINSLALQAVVEIGSTGNDSTSPAAADSAHTPPALLPSKLVDVYKQNRPYIDELVDAARSLLRTAVNELMPTGALRHSPIRTHFRILSAAMFLLKSFALGAKESEVQTSMALLDRTIMALRKSVIDDVHLSLRIAELLHGLASTIRKKFVRLAVPSRTKRGNQTGRPTTSVPNATVTGTAGSSADRNASNAARGGPGQRPRSSHQMQQQNGTAITGFSPTTGLPVSANDDFYSLIGADLAPNFVDLKDPSITIMPPPDFLGQLGTDIYAPVSPHSSGGVGTSAEQASPASLSSPTIGTATTNHRASAPRTNSMAQTPSQPAAFSPSAGNTSMPPFSPMSTNSGGGYDWLALDFNGLLQQGGGMHYGNNNHSPNPPHQGFKNDMGVQDGDDDGENKEQNASNAWTSGAFGPEISEGLEMLGALGAFGFDDLGNGGMGNNGW